MQPSARLPLWSLLVVWVLIVGAFGLGVYLAPRPALPEPQLTTLQLVHRQILESYVSEQDPHKLMELALAGMARLDDYSEYVPPREVAGFVESLTGTYEGVGMVHTMVDDHVFVLFPLADSPAERAGLLPGDEIVAVDGTELASMTGRERNELAVARIRGAAGTTVRLQIARPGSAAQTFTVERGSVSKPCVKWAQLLDAEARIAYVHLTDFYPDAAGELQAALDGLQQAGDGMHGLVLDLRDNPGGNLDACFAMANLFLRGGTIATVRRRGDELVETHSADAARCRFPDLPLALLVDADSASASEVLSGALQDHQRAAVVGERTFGKGMVNTVYTWKDRDFRLKLTTGYYYTPNGRNLEDHQNRKQGAARTGGIVPDHAVALTPTQAQAVATALARHEVPPRHRAAVAAFAAAHALAVPGIVPPTDDPQLARALEVLRERVAVGAAGGK